MVERGLTTRMMQTNGSLAAASAAHTLEDPALGHAPNALFSPGVIADIQEKSRLGRYRLRGFGARRALPSLDDLTIVPAGLSRMALEGYREHCSADTVIGSRAEVPLRLKTPIGIAGMSYGALSATAKTALGRGATAVGTFTTTGDGGMLEAERQASDQLVYQCLPSRYGFTVEDLQRADAVEIVVGQGAKPGTGGLLLGAKVSGEIAAARSLPAGVDQRSPVRHPDWLGPDDLVLKLEELREATAGRIPMFVKLGAARVVDDVRLAVKAGADAVVLDGMEGGTAASPEALMDHTGIPTMAAVVEARRALDSMGATAVGVQLVVSGGIRSGVDVAKLLALGADAVTIGTAALLALNCNRPIFEADYAALGTVAGACHHCHTGRCPVGVATQEPELEARLDLDAATERVRNLLQALTMEVQMLARACGKSSVHHLSPEDLRALSPTAAAMTGIPLAGTTMPL